MNQSGVTDGPEDETRMGIAVLQPMGDGRAEDVAALAPVVTHPPTGDSAVDEALRQFDAVTDQPLDTQIEVGEQVHRVLLSRLADLGKE